MVGTSNQSVPVQHGHWQSHHVFRSRDPLEHAPSNLLQALLQITSQGMSSLDFPHLSLVNDSFPQMFFSSSKPEIAMQDPLSPNNYSTSEESAVAKKKVDTYCIVFWRLHPFKPTWNPKTLRVLRALLCWCSHIFALDSWQLGIAYFLPWHGPGWVQWMNLQETPWRWLPDSGGGPATCEESPRRCAWWSRHFVHPGTQNGHMNGAEGACSQEWKQDQ